MEEKKKWKEIADKAYQLGFEYEKKFHGCGQCVIAAASEALGIFNDDVFEAATGLCGGVGLDNQATCSAFTGGVLVIGMLYPRQRDRFDGDRENKYLNFRLVQELRKKINQNYGSSFCHEIHEKIYGRAYDLRMKSEQEAFELAGGHGDHGCTVVVADIARWTIEVIAKEKLSKK